MERLDKLLAATGRWSRREAKLLIREGRVLVDGRIAASGDEHIDPKSEIVVDGQILSCEEFTYIMLHKPSGILSATEDKRQKTVLDLLPEYLRRQELFPVGRLDKDTEGLLLLTNDGDLAHQLLSPKKHVDKVYFARLSTPMRESDCRKFAEGVVLADGTHCLPAHLQLAEDGCSAYITIREGKFHQIRRMVAACGSEVLYLKRLSMGPLALDEGLLAGDFRPLTEQETAKLLLCKKISHDL